MKTLVIDAADWKNADDVYESFFKAVGAPEWHGRNFDALRDSIATGQINEVEVPYTLMIFNFDDRTGTAIQTGADFIDLLRELQTEGCPVFARIVTY